MDVIPSHVINVLSTTNRNSSHPAGGINSAGLTTLESGPHRKLANWNRVFPLLLSQSGAHHSTSGKDGKALP
jgi:hypothetical protein